MGRMDDAKALVAQFRNVPSDKQSELSPKGWKLGRAELATALQMRLEGRLDGRPYPYQGQANLCGEAAFLYCLIKDRPDHYVKFAIGLWENAEFNLKNGPEGADLWVRPGPGTIKALPVSGQGGINQLDWLMMGSLSKPDRGNAAIDDGLSAATYPKDLVSWFASVGSQYIIRTFRLFSQVSGGRLVDFRNSIAHLSSSWTIFEIKPAIIQGVENIRFERHWVVLRDPAIFSLGKSCISPTIIDDDNSDKVTLSIPFVTWGYEDSPEYRFKINGKDGQLTDPTVDQFMEYFHGALVFPSIP